MPVDLTSARKQIMQERQPAAPSATVEVRAATASGFYRVMVNDHPCGSLGDRGLVAHFEAAVRDALRAAGVEVRS
jgi:hypothetical protein